MFTSVFYVCSIPHATQFGTHCARPVYPVPWETLGRVSTRLFGISIFVWQWSVQGALWCFLVILCVPSCGIALGELPLGKIYSSGVGQGGCWKFRGGVWGGAGKTDSVKVYAIRGINLQTPCEEHSCSSAVALSLWHFASPLRRFHFDPSPPLSVKESHRSKIQNAPGLS